MSEIHPDQYRLPLRMREDDAFNKRVNSLRIWLASDNESFKKDDGSDIGVIFEDINQSNKINYNKSIEYPMSFQEKCVKGLYKKTREEFKQLFKEKKNITEALNKQRATLEGMFKRGFPHVDHKRRHAVIVSLIKEAREYYIEDSLRDIPQSIKADEDSRRDLHEAITTPEVVVESPSEIYELQRKSKGYLEHIREYANSSLIYILNYVRKQAPLDK